MATKRGPKLEPKEINKYKVVVDNLPEKPQAQVFEDSKEEIKNKWEESGILDGLTGNADPKVTELFESETSHVINEAPELIAEDEFITSEAAKVPHFEFKDEYKLTHNGKDAVIDPLPQTEKRKKTVGELNQSELRLYHKTGFLPEI